METSTEMLHDIIGKIWDKEEIPTEWKEGYLAKIPKKRYLQECKNQRDNAPVSARKGPQQSYFGQTENSSEHQTQRSPGRLP